MWPWKLKLQRRRHFEPRFAGTQDKRRIGVSNAGGELPKRAGGTRVAVGAEKNFPGTDVALFRQRLVADAFIICFGRVLVRIRHSRFGTDKLWVVVVFQSLLAHEIPKSLNVAMAFIVGGEDVVVRNDDHPVRVPHFGIASELIVEDANRPRTADVVSHEDIDVDPDVFAGGRTRLARVLGKYLFGHGHAGHGWLLLIFRPGVKIHHIFAENANWSRR